MVHSPRRQSVSILVLLSMAMAQAACLGGDVAVPVNDAADFAQAKCDKLERRSAWLQGMAAGMAVAAGSSGFAALAANNAEAANDSNDITPRAQRLAIAGVSAGIISGAMQAAALAVNSRRDKACERAGILLQPYLADPAKAATASKDRKSSRE